MSKQTTQPLDISVMLVDDSSLMRQALADLVGHLEGVRIVAEAANGAHALEQLRQHSPDLILLDIEMPVMGGLEFLREARRHTDARVIVISSVAQLGSEECVEALRLGAEDIVPKPSGVLSLDMKDTRRDALFAAIRECTQGV